jgi:Rod binding domain-containing protein
MSSLAGISLDASTLATPTAGVDRNDPKKIAGAAKQFESLLVGEMLKSMHDADSGWMGTGDDSTSGPVMQMADEQFASALTNSGGLGLTSMVARGLAQESGAGHQR